MALEALVGYYRRFEATIPNFSAVVALSNQPLAREEFRGRTTDARVTEVPMTKLLASAQAGAQQPLTFTKTGEGTLFYSARLRYAADQLFQQGLDQGIRIERTYAPYVETGTRPAATTFKAGDLVRVDPDAPAHKGAPVRRRHRSAPCGLRARRVVVCNIGCRAFQESRRAGRRVRQLVCLVAAGRLRSRGAARRPRGALRHSAGRRASPVLVHRSRHDRRHLPDGTRTRRRDVRAGSVRQNGDGHGGREEVIRRSAKGLKVLVVLTVLVLRC